MADRKVDGYLLRVAQEIEGARAAGQARSIADTFSVPRWLRVNDAGEIQCYVLLSTLRNEHVQTLRQMGVRVELVSAPMRLVQGWIPSGRIRAVAQAAFVTRIKRPDYAWVRTGAHLTEGDSIHRADEVRARGVTGTGVKVGVISDGVDSRNAAAATGDLPETTPGSSIADIQLHPTQPGSGDEGTAILEIIHDLAPDASLAFSGPQTSAEMVNSIAWLADVAGCHVIIDDIGFFGEPFFADGPIAIAARNAVAGGVTYCSSAGNEAYAHYQGRYNESIWVPGVHDFGTDEVLEVYVPAGATVLAVLEWNDPYGGSCNDYDTWFVDLSSLDPIGEFTFYEQNCNDDPWEAALWANETGSGATIGLVIAEYNNPATRTLELYTLGGIVLDADGTVEDSIFGHPAVTEVISVGAIEAADPGNDDIEWFSSRGPATISFAPFPGVRNVPFCSAVDGVQVSGAGGFPSPFYGTSAAAPHAAGIAALYLSAHPGASPAEVRDALGAWAIDLGTAGWDTVFGHGRLDALCAILSASISAQPISQTASVCADEGVSFSIAAEGASDLSYQWRKDGGALTDGGNISGATTATLTIDPVGLGDAGAYDVVVTDECGQVTSGAATLTVEPPPTWCRDVDGDLYGDAGDSQESCQEPAGYVSSCSDCDDGNADIHPGAVEACNGIDDDCNGQVPANEANADGDAYRICEGDCDDGDAQVYPGADEICDGKDSDCNGDVPADEADADGDEFLICEADCDDGDDTVYPGAPELCDGKDNDCDADVPANEVDGDEDGFRICDEDCDDADGAVYPGAPELCDGKDNDCDGPVDEEPPQWCRDADGDTFGDPSDAVADCDQPPDYVGDCADCADNDGDVYPGAEEVCNGIDDDCDEQVDPPGSTGCAIFYRDEDGDGYGVSDSRCLCAGEFPYAAGQAGDCDDGDASVHPAAAEVCNGIDDNCDGQTDPRDSDACDTYYRDEDGDEYGTEDGRCLCAAAEPYAAVQSGDCDDADDTIHPAAPELCDGVDHDCDGEVPQIRSWYRDADGDGFGDAGRPVGDCFAPAGFVENNLDCDDSDAAFHPGAGERCDGLDNDCDGVVPDDELDDDFDGVLNCNDACPGIDDHADTDGDGTVDCFDNCPDFPNPRQADTDGDGAGDACDSTLDFERCHDDIVALATTPSGANVEFIPPKVSGGFGEVTLSCDHASGEFFPIGETVVSCTASDEAAAKTVICRFTVRVMGTAQAIEAAGPGASTGTGDQTCGACGATGPAMFGLTLAGMALLSRGQRRRR